MNRFTNLQDQERDLFFALKKEKERPFVNHSRIAGLTIRYTQVKSMINGFGKKHKVILVNMLYISFGIKQASQIYLTGITQEEAIEYVRYCAQTDNVKILEISAHELPVGKPINAVNK